MGAKSRTENPPVYTVAEESVAIGRIGVLNVKIKLQKFMGSLNPDWETLYQIDEELGAILDELSV